MNRVVDLLYENQGSLLKVAEALKQSIGPELSDDAQNTLRLCRIGFPEELRNFVRELKSGNVVSLEQTPQNRQVVRALTARIPTLRDDMIRAGWTEFELKGAGVTESAKEALNTLVENHDVNKGTAAVMLARTLKKSTEINNSQELVNIALTQIAPKIDMHSEFQNMIQSLKGSSTNDSEISVNEIPNIG
jgi:hypothetical protein